MTRLPKFDADDDERERFAGVVDERSIARQIALQALYELDATNHQSADVINTHLRTQEPSRRAARYMQQLVAGVQTFTPLLDEAISRYAPEFPLNQIAIIDRNIMRIAIYEFAVYRKTPVSVAIDEAVELAKLFGAEGSPSFVNGVLGALADDEAKLAELSDAVESQTTELMDEQTNDDL